MRDLFKEYLFTKNYLVSETSSTPEDAFSTLFGLGKIFGIVIDRGANLASPAMVRIAENCLGLHVPRPFYGDFPSSVLSLTKNQLLVDQLYSYFVTYGLNDFEGEGTRSIFEDKITRALLNEKTEAKHFEIITQEEAWDKLAGYVNDLLMSTRPLNKNQYELVKYFILDRQYMPGNIASKNTAIKLLIDLHDPNYAKFLALPDVPKILEEVLAVGYQPKYGPAPSVNKLNLKNRDRKFLSSIITKLIAKATSSGSRDKYFKDCVEKRKTWKGLLHHIHFKPVTENETIFATEYIFGNEKSDMSIVTELAESHHIVTACHVLAERKGATAVLRNLNYLLSRCETSTEREYVISKAFTSDSTVALIQQLYNYGILNVEDKSPRYFKFTHQNLLKVHEETPEEVNKRKTWLTAKDKEAICLSLENRVQELLKGRLGRVYIDEDMISKGVPIQEAAGNTGYGILPRGSRVHLDGRVVRLFTYWEKVNDIDLSAIGIDEKGRGEEFSWRTFWTRQSEAICFSGDQTRGYEGGSEYVDVDLAKFRSMYPYLRYLIVCDNVFSGVPFDTCTCTAGYMLREKVDSGEVFEPKTVKSSFLVKGSSTFSYLFAIDLTTNDFVWLNVSKDSHERVAGESNFAFLIPYIKSAEIFNMYKLFTYLATEVVDNPEEADVIVSDKITKAFNEEQIIIHSYDTEKVMALMNQK